MVRCFLIFGLSVILSLGGKSLDLGRGETGFSSEDILARLAAMPGFMGGDRQIDPSGKGIKPPPPVIPAGGCAL